MMRRLTGEDIRAVRDLPTEEVYVPEWDGTVLVRGLGGKAKDSYEESMLKEGGGLNYTNVRARLVVRCLVDEDGNRLFQDGDEEFLGTKSGVAIGRIFDVASRLSGLTKTDVETLVGNSEGGGEGDSTSPSPFGAGG